jgi:hypothetical protein
MMFERLATLSNQQNLTSERSGRLGSLWGAMVRVSFPRPWDVDRPPASVATGSTAPPPCLGSTSGLVSTVPTSAKSTYGAPVSTYAAPKGLPAYAGAFASTSPSRSGIFSSHGSATPRANTNRPCV